MLRYLIIPLLCIWGASVTGAPRDFGILGGKARVGTGSGYVNGITATTLYDGYWDPGQPLIHRELDGSDTTTSAVSRDWTDYDPQKADSSLTWNTDTVAARAGILATLARLQTEWGTASQKYAGSFTNSYYVDWATGNDTTGDGSSGSKWKTLDHAIDYIKANHVDGSNLLDAATEIVLSSGVQYLDQNGGAGTGQPPGGYAMAVVDNIIGSATKPLVIRGATGDMKDVIVRTDHAYMETFFDDFDDNTYRRDGGIQIRNASDYIEVWDMTLVGPMFELPYRDGEGYSAGVWSFSTGSGVANNKVINCELTQWLHCGVKTDAGLSVYGSYLHNNGITFHDHGIYISKNREVVDVEGNIIVNSYGLAITPREQTDTPGVTIRGNIMGYNGGRIMDPGGYGMEISHNLFLYPDDQFIQIGGRLRAPTIDNNIFYGATAVILEAISGAYVRPVSHVWRTNANNSGVTIPSSPPAISAHPGSGVAMSDQANIREANGHAYAVFPGGAGTTGATAPTHTDGSSVSDGGVTWTDIGTATESYGTWTTIDADDFADFANFDFRPATVSDLKSNGTDIGYGTTIGPFSTSP